MELRASRQMEIEREKSQTRELQREKPPLRSLADSGVRLDSKKPGEKPSGKAENAEQGFLQLPDIGETDFLV